MNTVTFSAAQLEDLLSRAAQRGAESVIRRLVVYDYTRAAQRLGICENTLRKRIRERKINPVDGRISETEIERYLSAASRPVRLPLD